MFKPTQIIVHCSDSAWGDAKAIDEWHKARGWDGIGYHMVINNGHPRIGVGSDSDGYLEFGRPLSIQGAHCKGQNHNSIGICLIGTNTFTDKQMDTLKFECESLCNQYGMDKDVDIHGHNEYSTKTCPNFDVSEWVQGWNKLKGGLDDFVEQTPNLYDRMQALEERVDSIEVDMGRHRGVCKDILDALDAHLED